MAKTFREEAGFFGANVNRTIKARMAEIEKREALRVSLRGDMPIRLREAKASLKTAVEAVAAADAAVKATCRVATMAEEKSSPAVAAVLRKKADAAIEAAAGAYEASFTLQDRVKKIEAKLASIDKEYPSLV